MLVIEIHGTHDAHAKEVYEKIRALFASTHSGSGVVIETFPTTARDMKDCPQPYLRVVYWFDSDMEDVAKRLATLKMDIQVLRLTQFFHAET